jgi:hypothetical protein
VPRTFPEVVPAARARGVLADVGLLLLLVTPSGEASSSSWSGELACHRIGTRMLNVVLQVLTSDQDNEQGQDCAHQQLHADARPLRETTAEQEVRVYGFVGLTQLLTHVLGTTTSGWTAA